MNKRSDKFGRGVMRRGLWTVGIVVLFLCEGLVADWNESQLEGLPEPPLGIAGITAVDETLYQVKMESPQDLLNFPIRLNDKLAGVVK
jgi:hypothetical protein